ncbi:hypothetical protein LCGC14_1770080, partial [marine sediment metagenome]
EEFKTVQSERDNLAGPVAAAAGALALPDERQKFESEADELEKQIKPDGDLEAAAEKAGKALTEASGADARAVVAAQPSDGESPMLVAHQNALNLFTVSGGDKVSKKSVAWLESEIATLEAAQAKPVKAEKRESLTLAAQAEYNAAAKARVNNRALITKVAELRKSVETDTNEITRLQAITGGKTETEIESKLAELDTQLEALRKKCSVSGLVADYERRKAETVKKRGQLHAKVENWESVCKALDPKSEALTALFSSGKEVFAAAFEKATTALGMTISLAEDYSFRAPGFGQINSIGYLSKSRRYRVGAALLIAVCAQIGFDTVILDEGDILWGEAKMDMTKLLRSAQGMGLNAMLFTTGKAEAQEINADTHIYAVDQGAVSNG